MKKKVNNATKYHGFNENLSRLQHSKVTEVITSSKMKTNQTKQTKRSDRMKRQIEKNKKTQNQLKILIRDKNTRYSGVKSSKRKGTIHTVTVEICNLWQHT